jgi:hypothetical protein
MWLIFFPWQNKYKNCKPVEISIRLGLWKKGENGGQETNHIFYIYIELSQ